MSDRLEKINQRIQQMRDESLGRYANAFSYEQYNPATDGKDEKYKNLLLNTAAALCGSPETRLNMSFVETADDETIEFLNLFCY